VQPAWLVVFSSRARENMSSEAVRIQTLPLQSSLIFSPSTATQMKNILINIFQHFFPAKMKDKYHSRTSRSTAVIQNQLLQHNKQHHRKVLLNSIHLIGHTLGFHPQTQK